MIEPKPIRTCELQGSLMGPLRSAPRQQDTFHCGIGLEGVHYDSTEYHGSRKDQMSIQNKECGFTVVYTG